MDPADFVITGLHCIAFLLFLDVGRWLSFDWKISEVYEHPKNQGQVIRSETSHGHFDSQEAKINFAFTIGEYFKMKKR